MQVKLLGLADHVTVGGPHGPETYQATQGALVAFRFSDAWDEAKGHAAIRAMEAAGNVAAGGTITVSQAASVVSHMDPDLAHQALAGAAQAADEIIAAQHGGGITVANAIPIAIHLAQNEGLLQGTSGQVAAAVGSILAGILAK